MDRISTYSIQNELDFMIEVKVMKKYFYFFDVHNHPFNLNPEKRLKGAHLTFSWFISMTHNFFQFATLKKKLVRRGWKTGFSEMILFLCAHWCFYIMSIFPRTNSRFFTRTCFCLERICYDKYFKIFQELGNLSTLKYQT